MRISVLMGVYNGEKFLAEALESILKQSFTDFEFIIVNDGSSDRSKEIILSYDDPRIVYVENEGNRGLIYTLNRGLQLAQGKYIARMDADDIALDHRLERQYEFMESNPSVVVCGSSVELFNEHQVIGTWIVPITEKAIKMELLFRPCLPHSTAFLRADVFRKNGFQYSSDFVHAEDYALWSTLLRNNYAIGNLPEILLRYRMHSNSIGMGKRMDQLATTKKIQIKQFEFYLGSPLSESESDLFDEVFTPSHPADDIHRISHFIHRFLASDQKHGHFDRAALQKALIHFFWTKLYQSFPPGKIPFGYLFPPHQGSFLLIKSTIKDRVKKILGKI